MKNINIILSFCWLALMTSCYGLDRETLYTGSSDSWYTTQDEFEMALKNLYRDSFWPLDSHGWTDDLQARNTLSFVVGGTINSQTPEVVTRWNDCYTAIARANTVIANLEKAAEIGIPEDKIDHYRAEALFVRAVEYAILTTCFGDVVYTEKILGIEEALEMGRTDKASIMECVYRDLDIAASILPVSYLGSESKRATKGAAYALKARYALYNEDWEIAYTAAKNCMDLNIYSLHADYSELFLASTKNPAEGVLVFPRSVEYGFIRTNAATVQGLITRNRGGYASVYPSFELFLSYLCTDGLPIDESPLFNPRKPFENRDPRCAATIVEFETEHLGVLYDPNPVTQEVYSSIAGDIIPNQDCFYGSQYASYNGLVFKKGIDEAWVNNGTFEVDPDKIFIRYAEVLLTYAEAKIEAGEIDQSALDAINKVRARAYGVDYTDTANYPSVTTTDQNELRKTLRIERRMEFAFENLRYMDLIRWRLAEKALNLPNYRLLTKDDLITKVVNANKWFFSDDPAHKIEIDEDGIADLSPLYQAGLLSVAVQRSFDPERQYLWPIPAEEILINSNLGQNDNY